MGGLPDLISDMDSIVDQSIVCRTVLYFFGMNNKIVGCTMQVGRALLEHLSLNLDH